jgi:predicted RNase H-like HicB family nuclease
MAPVTTYTAVCEREGDWWVVTVPELDAGAVTQTRTLDEVPATVADLVALMTDADAASIEVDMKVHTTPGPDPGKIARLALAAVGAAAAAAQRAIRSAARVPVR